ncbi:MAG: 50S ribosomal protein L11 [Candidatus Lightella neohaematopini]|nr:50S ribosomal protein L11 [Candidatus Lightella neohaematopini]MCV2531169.1 50S ribosomal protein L11 [Candidatus Lightella neohaematopini]
MAKQIKSIVKLQIPSGVATPAPPIGPTLGQHGINIVEFCKKFNHVTSGVKNNTPLPTIITIYVDNSFTFICKSPPVTFLIKQMINIQTGSDKPGKNIIGKINYNLIKEIAQLKIKDMNTIKLESIIKSIIGSAKSMGIIINE